MELVPIKVKIGLRGDGNADHPDWTKLPMINSDSEVRKYAPFGWMYDKSCGHKEVRIEGNVWDSSLTMQWGCLLVTREFADEAKQYLPDVVTEITEIEFEDFYNTKSRAHISENNYDVKILQGLQIELDLKEKLGLDTTELKVKIGKAINPDDSSLGIKKNKEKTWQQFKIIKDVSVK